MTSLGGSSETGRRPVSRDEHALDIQQHGIAYARGSRRISRSRPRHAPNGASEIRYLYLTFETLLPVVNTAVALENSSTPCRRAQSPYSSSSSSSSPSSPQPLPQEPDLTPFANPVDWPQHRKNLMLALSCIATFLTAYTAGSYSPPLQVMVANLNGVAQRTPHLDVVAGVTTFCMGFALAPMVLAPLSEINGRYPVFVVSGIVYVAFQAACGAVTDIVGMLVARFLTGVGGSVFSTMVGGVIADLWDAEGRNTPMALFSGAVLAGTGAGPLVGAVFAGSTVKAAGTWRWVFWHQAIAAAVLMVALVLCFEESRGSVLLSRKARVLNRWYEELEQNGCYGAWVEEEVMDRLGVSSSESDMTARTDRSERRTTQLAGERSTGERDGRTDNSNEEEKISSRHSSSISGLTLERIRWRVKADEERSSIGKMISISVYRPFHLLFTEPVVFFFSLWVSFAWAVLYLTFGCIPLVYTTVYSWSVEESGRIFIGLIIGSVIGTVMSIFQEQVLRHPNWDADSGVDPATLSAGWLFLRRRLPTNTVESRLYFTCVTATLLPIGLFVFGLSARPNLPWAGPAVAVTLATVGIYAVYLAAFNYLADVYQEYASSALAAQSCCRNVLGGILPLLTWYLFRGLGPPNAGLLLGCIATALTFVPWVLVLYGERIRARSKIAVSFG